MDSIEAMREEGRYIVDPDTGCWNWTGPLRGKGYGVLHINGKRFIAHRWFYERLVGPIPLGLCLDHLCRNKRCVNPAHLEPVTNRENVLRGIGETAQNSAKTYCPKGHEYTPENTRIGHHGSRQCRECDRLYHLNRYNTDKRYRYEQIQRSINTKRHKNEQAI